MVRGSGPATWSRVIQGVGASESRGAGNSGVFSLRLGLGLRDNRTLTYDRFPWFEHVPAREVVVPGEEETDASIHAQFPVLDGGKGEGGLSTLRAR